MTRNKTSHSVWTYGITVQWLYLIQIKISIKRIKKIVLNWFDKHTVQYRISAYTEVTQWNELVYPFSSKVWRLLSLASLCGRGESGHNIARQPTPSFGSELLTERIKSKACSSESRGLLLSREEGELNLAPNQGNVWYTLLCNIDASRVGINVTKVDKHLWNYLSLIGIFNWPAISVRRFRFHFETLLLSLKSLRILFYLNIEIKKQSTIKTKDQFKII